MSAEAFKAAAQLLALRLAAAAYGEGGVKSGYSCARGVAAGCPTPVPGLAGRRSPFAVRLPVASDSCPDAAEARE
ncbi:hypothetical protein GCM10010231_65110 [Streptomyces sindenensis]|nr:hypothetical protein GCM10010231_65110 [Streptomyces sindenensis]